MTTRIPALLFLFIILGGTAAEAQVRAAPARSIGDKITCHVGGASYVLTPNKRLIFEKSFTVNYVEVQEVFEKVADYTKLTTNIYTVPVTEDINVEICPGEVNYVAYNADWLKKFYYETNSAWAMYAIIAHEIGHFALNHDRKAVESDPEIELEADQFAGEILAKMGACLSDAQAAFNSRIMQRQKGDSHPPIAQRLVAVKTGWEKFGESCGESRPQSAGTHVKTNKDAEFRNLLKTIASASDTGFTSLVGESDSRNDRSKSKVNLPGAVETIVKPYHSVQAWMGYYENMADAEGIFDFLLQQLRLTFPDWSLEEKSPYKQQPIKSFVSTSPNGKTYISLYLDRRSGSSFFVKLNVFTRVKKP